MVTFLEVSTVLFQMSFADAAFFLWDGGQLLSLVDAVFCVVASFADFFWFKQYESSLEFIEANVVRYCMLIGYIAAHIWSTTVKPRHRYWKKATLNDGVLALERLKHVLICRSTAPASELLPIMNEMWGALVECWGRRTLAPHVFLKFTSLAKMKQRMSSFAKRWKILQSSILVRSTRPPRPRKIIENHTLNVIATRRSSCAVVAFGGSPEISLRLRKRKISNDMLTTITKAAAGR
jgi:hypothetical protein